MWLGLLGEQVRRRILVLDDVAVESGRVDLDAVLAVHQEQREATCEMVDRSVGPSSSSPPAGSHRHPPRRRPGSPTVLVRRGRYPPSLALRLSSGPPARSAPIGLCCHTLRGGRGRKPSIFMVCSDHSRPRQPFRAWTRGPTRCGWTRPWRHSVAVTPWGCRCIQLAPDWRPDALPVRGRHDLPFLLAALAFDKVLPRFMGMRAVLQYSTPIAGIVMLVLGLLIISGNDNLFEELLV